MSGERDADQGGDSADWLAAQFETGELKTPPAPTPPTVPPVPERPAVPDVPARVPRSPIASSSPVSSSSVPSNPVPSSSVPQSPTPSSPASQASDLSTSAPFFWGLGPDAPSAGAPSDPPPAAVPNSLVPPAAVPNTPAPPSPGIGGSAASLQETRHTAPSDSPRGPTAEVPTQAYAPGVADLHPGGSGASIPPAVHHDSHGSPGAEVADPLNSLFGESQFRDYVAVPATMQNPFARTASASQPEKAGSRKGDGTRPPTSGIGRTQVILLWVAGSTLGVLALVALFVLGTRLPDLLGPAPAVAPTPSASPSASPEPVVLPLGPVEPGEYDWDELLGGECLEPYSSPWEETFTVVDCAEPHAAQLVTRGQFGSITLAPDATGAPADGTTGVSASVYPGAEALQAEINLLCTPPTVIDYAAAGAFSDIQFEASYAVTADEWADGHRDYFCFVSRSSGEPITGTLAVPQAAPAQQ